MKQEKIPTSAEISLPIPQDSKTKTLVYQVNSIHMQEDKPPRGAHHFSSIIDQDKHPKNLHKRERERSNAQRGCKFLTSSLLK
jgi:hypothetical protein